LERKKNVWNPSRYQRKKWNPPVTSVLEPPSGLLLFFKNSRFLHHHLQTVKGPPILSIHCRTHHVHPPPWFAWRRGAFQHHSLESHADLLWPFCDLRMEGACVPENSAKPEKLEKPEKPELLSLPSSVALVTKAWFSNKEIDRGCRTEEAEKGRQKEEGRRNE